MSAGGVTTAPTTDTSTNLDQNHHHHEPGTTNPQFSKTTAFGSDELTTYQRPSDSIEYAPVAGRDDTIGTTYNSITHHGDTHDPSQHTPRGSHGSHGKGEGGLKGTLHKIADKLHPYNKDIEVSSCGH